MFAALFQKFNSPLKVQKFLLSYPYNHEKKGETLRSAKSALHAKTLHCLEACFVAAAILENGGYPPLVLSFESQDDLDHVLYVYREPKGWGSIGRSRDEGLQGRRAVFRSVRDLARSYIDPYIDHTGRIQGYAVANLNDSGADWKHASRNLWRVENYLIDLKHVKLNCSDAHYKKLHARYERGIKLPRQKSWL